MVTHTHHVAAPACRPRSSGRRHGHRPAVDERRSGFDRRHNVCRSTIAAALEAPVLRLRDDHRLLLDLLFLINVLNVLDLFITVTVLKMGAVELNPLMAYLLRLGPAPALAVKTGLLLAATAGLWKLRRYRVALTTTLGLLVAYTALVAFELVGLLRLLA
jgi:hypothetical protein